MRMGRGGRGKGNREGRISLLQSSQPKVAHARFLIHYGSHLCLPALLIQILSFAARVGGTEKNINLHKHTHATHANADSPHCHPNTHHTMGPLSHGQEGLGPSCQEFVKSQSN